MPQIILYTRRGCCLCDEAHDLLVQSGQRPRLVDIDDHPDLVARYGHCVPVVEIDGKKRFQGRVSPVLLRRLLARAAM